MKRIPAVAGTFYPFEKQKLKKTLDELLSVSVNQKKVKGGIVPHAGYQYSGKTAAYFYKTIEGHRYNNIVILGPNHTGLGEPISLSDKEEWTTPLGDIEVNQKLGDKIYGKKDSLAHMKEHSIEVQLPFLQKVLKDFKIVPICIGDQSKEGMEKLGNSLSENLTKNDLVIISSDLSHYVNYETAFENDHKLINSIKNKDTDLLYANIEKYHSACGYGGIAALIKYAEKSKVKLLDYSTSGATNRNLSEVVGYASLIFY